MCEREGGREGKASSNTKHSAGKFVFHTAPLSGVKYISWEKTTVLRAIPREQFFFLRVIYVEAAGALCDPTREGEGPGPLREEEAGVRRWGVERPAPRLTPRLSQS